MKTTIIIVVAVITIMIVLYMILIGNINKVEPQILKLDEPIKLIGMEINTNDKDVYKDVGRIASEFNTHKKSIPFQI